jgi:hypothetical protein
VQGRVTSLAGLGTKNDCAGEGQQISSDVFHVLEVDVMCMKQAFFVS